MALRASDHECGVQNGFVVARNTPQNSPVRRPGVWTVMAVVFDYVFIVRAFNPSDRYYKLDVYVYYVLTFTIPLAVGWWKARGGRAQVADAHVL